VKAFDSSGHAHTGLYVVLRFVGAEQIVRLVLGFRERLHSDTARMELVEVNGETGLCVRSNGRLTAVMAIETDGVRIHAVYAVINPDKLASVRE
jgi:RNA polymerase sigma-70 factor (ECF subfamily)